MRVIDHRLRLAPGDPDDLTIVHHETPNQYGVMDEIWCQIHHYIDSRDPMEPVRVFMRG